MGHKGWKETKKTA